MHRIVVLGIMIACGITSSIGFYFLMRDAIGGPVPLWLIIFDTLLSFAGGLLVGEIGWRINKWIDSF